MALKEYTEQTIQQLSSLEHIRKRSGMYIGRLGDGAEYNDGIYILLKEVLDNAVDEFISGYGKRVEVKVDERSVTCRDYGRGIPLGKLRECVSQINTGGKFNDDVFQFSVGMNGVGTKAVNALSERFVARSVRDGRFAQVEYSRGELVSETGGETKERNGTLISFTPDPTIFKGYTFHPEHVERRMRLTAYLNSGLAIVLNDTTFRSEKGLLDLMYAYDVYATLYGLAPTGAFDPSVSFGDSIFEDTGVEFARRKGLVDSGYLRPELLVGWYFGVSEQEAREKYMPEPSPMLRFPEE